ncbi:class I SAM-dependent methyltransferase [Gynuella sp.]|uniref:class I SAM-dependent methyltransferase n=1 Tax=Gynuella sp. TaxID=2969146 RepID=UPI003D0F3D39
MIVIRCLDQSHLAYAHTVSDIYGWPVCEETPPDTLWELILQSDYLSVRSPEYDYGTPLYVDFVGGAMGHRRLYGGGKGQDLAKAVGLNKAADIKVLDATAGLGRDAFVLASLGCSVQLWERNPVVHALLADGLRRAEAHSETTEIVARMELCAGTASVNEASRPEVIYLDPMFPPSKKSAKPKKDMQLFHKLVQQDQDADELLPWALKTARNRVVVKRPRIAPYLAGVKPSYELTGKSNRFDVYVIAGF